MPNDRLEKMGYELGIPLAMGTEFIVTEGVLGLEAIENAYQGQSTSFRQCDTEIRTMDNFRGNTIEEHNRVQP